MRLYCTCSAIVLLVGCVQADPWTQIRTQIDAEVRNEVRAHVETAAVKLESRIEAGEINIGGSGDSVTAWILAGGMALTVLVATPAGGLFYQKILRPQRIKRSGQRTQKE